MVKILAPILLAGSLQDSQQKAGFLAGSRILAAKILVGNPAKIPPDSLPEAGIPAAKMVAGTMLGILSGSHQDPSGFFNRERILSIYVSIAVGLGR